MKLGKKEVLWIFAWKQSYKCGTYNSGSKLKDYIFFAPTSEDSGEISEMITEATMKEFSSYFDFYRTSTKKLSHLMSKRKQSDYNGNLVISYQTV